MRTETVTREIYTFEELSEEAKEKAIEKLSNINLDYEWWESEYEDAANIGLKLTTFELERNKHAEGFFLFNSATKVADKIMSEHGNECATYKTAFNFLNERDTLVRKFSDGVNFDVVAEENDYEFDREADELEEQFLEDILSDYADILQKQYEYLYSEEAIKETIEANEYEFTEDGEQI
jgi:hypothetical protein